MHADDRAMFITALVTLSELFGKPLSPAVQVLYVDALQDLDAGVLVAAMHTAARHCTFMPKPSELRKLAVGDSEDHAERAWLAMRAAMTRIGAYDSLVTQDPALGETILAVFGAWPEACRADLSSEMWASKRKEFGRVYRVMQDRALTGARYLAGIIESQNAKTDAWAKYTRVGVIAVDGATIQRLEPAEAEAIRLALAVSSELGTT